MTNWNEAWTNPRHDAHHAAVALEARLDTDTTVDAEGILRWSHNGLVPPRDVVAFYNELWGTADVDACDAARLGLDSGQDGYHIAPWHVSGVHTGWRVVERRGPDVDYVAGFAFDRYTPGDARSAKAKALDYLARCGVCLDEAV